ncbi:flagellar filament capping protein FliD [Paenibacillus sp. P13VS]|uniref:flagellar filament capping protein FliD n=1 Tax=Paenibacillus sp. P13VS TaxID=2697367 RepID=UPI00187B9E54|nr:flagellar filament capping protein FliD [Paenibacillus sp. P13VS]MBE7681620.1 flagellar filament capping protein FliD [Paenibacillus sp. P13VS]
MRINGFSGMDIDSMVKSLMTAKKAPLDKLNQQKQLLQWTRDSYREFNSKLVDFRTSKLIDKYGVSSALNVHKAVVTGNTDAVKAEAFANATGIDMEVKVNQLATKASVETNGVGQGVTTKTTLAELVASGSSTTVTEADKAKEYNFTVNGVKFTDKEGKSLFNGATSIATVISTINGNSKANVIASFDEITGKLIISSKTSGQEGKVALGTGSEENTLLDVFKGIKQVELNDGTLVNTKPGVNAVVEINGTLMEKSSNIFTVNGVQLTLLNKSTVDNPVSKIKTQVDSQNALDSIKSLVEDYNNLLGFLNSKVSEEKYRDFLPLTDEQKVEMKEDDITKWTEKAKSGLFKNDDILSSLITEMRSTITSQLGPLSSIGITTGKYYENGKLKIDEKKLKEAIADNPQKIVDILQGPLSAPNEGILDKLADKVNAALDKISLKAGTDKFSTDLNSIYKEESVMGKRLKNYNKQIKEMQTRLTSAEERYYKQFTAMETAMSKYQSQSSSLLSSLGMTSQ